MPTETIETQTGLIVERFELGPFATNCYVVRRQGDASCWLADVGFGPGGMLGHLDTLDTRVSDIVLTHAHVDHIAGLEEARAATGASVHLHADEAHWLDDPELNLSKGFGLPMTAKAAEAMMQHGQRLDLAGGAWKVLHVPGHSPGSVALYSAEHAVCIVGDSLFYGSIGRHDFPTSDGPMLVKSIKDHLYTLPDDTIVLPGHGPKTSVGREKATNPFVRAD